MQQNWNSVPILAEYNDPMNWNCDECRAISEALRAAMTEAWPEQLAKFKELLGPAGDNLPTIEYDPAANSASKAHSVFRRMLEHQAKTGHTVPLLPRR